MNDQSMLIPTRVDKKGNSESRTTLTPSSDTRDKVIHCDVRPSIPVIFLPGVMGTNLKSNAGASVWAPPNMTGVADTIGAIFSLLGWSFRNAATRQTRLNPNDTMVDDRDDIDVGESGLSRTEARERGWGEIHRWSYHGILAYLQKQLNEPMLHGEKEGDWHEHFKNASENETIAGIPVTITDPAIFGAMQKGDPLTEDELKLFANFQYPVHAVGYNWTQSNGKSAETVFARIKKICDRYGDGTKAIAVTHSMGGLVARAIARIVPGGEELIYGVVHGAQPATGAPMAAKRFRTGAEDFKGGAFFGSNDAEWTAVAASSQSALELMPMPDYRGGGPWWILSDEQGNPILSLPKSRGGAASEIYLSSAWYGLIPDDSLVDPAGIIKNSAEVAGARKSVRGVFSDAVKLAAIFQGRIERKYHRSTYALFGDGTLTGANAPTETAESLLAFGTVNWKGTLPAGTTEEDMGAAELLHDNHKGTWRILVRGQVATLKIQPPDEPGDGTVPATSAAAQLGGEGVKQVFKQGGFEHQFCYQHPWARWAALYGIAKVAQLVPQKCHA